MWLPAFTLREVSRLVASGHCPMWLVWMAATMSMAAHAAVGDWVLKSTPGSDEMPNELVALQLCNGMTEKLEPMFNSDANAEAVGNAVRGKFHCDEVRKTH